MKSKQFIFVSLACILSGVFIAGCSRPKLFSSWRYHEITIDGRYMDWDEAASYYNQGLKVVLNLVNDADYMYICLISRNRTIESRMMESSFIIWFDSDGGKNKLFGVCFPTGLKSIGMTIDDEKRDRKKDWQDQEDKGGLIDREKVKLRDKNFNQRLETLEGLQEKLKILNAPVDLKSKNQRPGFPPGKLDQDKAAKNGPVRSQGPLKDWPKELTLPEAGKLGIEARIGRQNGYFVYELKVPLIESDKYPYAIGIKPGKPIGLGLEIGNARIAMMGDGLGGGRASPGDRGGGNRFDGGGISGGEETFRLWAIVILSTGGDR
jgi:hypothetical protein